MALIWCRNSVNAYLHAATGPLATCRSATAVLMRETHSEMISRLPKKVIFSLLPFATTCEIEKDGKLDFIEVAAVGDAPPPVGS